MVLRASIGSRDSLPLPKVGPWRTQQMASRPQLYGIWHGESSGSSSFNFCGLMTTMNTKENIYQLGFPWFFSTPCVPVHPLINAQTACHANESPNIIVIRTLMSPPCVHPFPFKMFCIALPALKNRKLTHNFGSLFKPANTSVCND